MVNEVMYGWEIWNMGSVEMLHGEHMEQFWVKNFWLHWGYYLI